MFIMVVCSNFIIIILWLLWLWWFDYYGYDVFVIIRSNFISGHDGY